jgi:hypothetical protein
MATGGSVCSSTGGFQCFIPLAFRPANTRLNHLAPFTGRLDLQTVALARLMLDNIPHIKAYWIMLGVKTTQVALHFGAADLDGAVVDQRITRAAGGQAGAFPGQAPNPRRASRGRPSSPEKRPRHGDTRGGRVAEHWRGSPPRAAGPVAAG